LVVLGSNGEFPFLTSTERIEVLRTAKLEAAKAEKVCLSRLRAFMHDRATHHHLDGGFPATRVGNRAQAASDRWHRLCEHQGDH
jgi:hypothetical protein